MYYKGRVHYKFMGTPGSVKVSCYADSEDEAKEILKERFEKTQSAKLALFSHIEITSKIDDKLVADTHNIAVCSLKRILTFKN